MRKLSPTHDAISLNARGWLNDSEKNQIRRSAIEQAKTLQAVARQDVGLLLYSSELEDIEDAIHNARVLGNEYALVGLPALYASMGKLVKKMNSQLEKNAKASTRMK